MNRKEILDNEELRELAIGLAPGFFDSRKVDLNVLERGHCYPQIVPALMKVPTERAAAFLDRLLGPYGADFFPNHSELIDFWKRLKELELLSPSLQPTTGEVSEAAKPITSSGRSLEITSSWKDAWYLHKTTQPNYETRLSFDLASAPSITTTITKNIMNSKYEKGQLNIHSPLDHLHSVAETMTQTIVQPNPDDETKRIIESEFRLFELGTWPIGVDCNKILYVFVPAEKLQS